MICCRVKEGLFSGLTAKCCCLCKLQTSNTVTYRGVILLPIPSMRGQLTSGKKAPQFKLRVLIRAQFMLRTWQRPIQGFRENVCSMGWSFVDSIAYDQDLSEKHWTWMVPLWQRTVSLTKAFGRRFFRLVIWGKTQFRESFYSGTGRLLKWVLQFVGCDKDNCRVKKLMEALQEAILLRGKQHEFILMMRGT